ncbi:transcription termination factor MTERF9, chloroplastic [Cocos nucifera]|nr:transcription termination factor MTERF9, chloroplastic [Cocos nucifera]
MGGAAAAVLFTRLLYHRCRSSILVPNSTPPISGCGGDGSFGSIFLFFPGGVPYISPSSFYFSSFASSYPAGAGESVETETLNNGLGLPSPSQNGGGASSPTDATDVFRRWGCTESEVSRILSRRPALRHVSLPALQSNLQVLRGLGVLGPDLVRIITCRPRFLFGSLALGLDARLDFLRTLFPSDAVLRRAVVRNPSLLTYDVDRTMRPCVQLYEALGIARRDLGRLLVSRPTIIPRSSLDDEKLDLVHRTRLPATAAMYKYALSIVAVSRLETLRAKFANLEKFGFSPDEVMGLFARTPNVLTLSVDKIQRNMTYIMGTMKLPARVVLDQPFLLYCNLDKVLRPRYLVGLKLQEMGLEPRIKGPALVQAMRMKESRFLKVFVRCHQEDVAGALMEYYASVKGSGRLAESSRSVKHKGFPF